MNLKDTMYLRGNLPEAAKQELEMLLQSNAQISTAELEKVLIKHGFTGDIERLQAKHRKQKIQQFARKYRDEQGKRDILSHQREDKRYYVVIENCRDIDALDNIGDEIAKHIRGLENSLAKVAARKRELLAQSREYKLTPRPKKKKPPTDKGGSKE